MRSEHEAFLGAAATFVTQQDTYLDALALAAPPEPIGVDDFFGIFFGAMEAADLASPFTTS